MNKFQLTSNSSNQTIDIAKKLAKYLSKSDVIILTGELGSRKNQIY